MCSGWRLRVMKNCQSWKTQCEVQTPDSRLQTPEWFWCWGIIARNLCRLANTPYSMYVPPSCVSCLMTHPWNHLDLDAPSSSALWSFSVFLIAIVIMIRYNLSVLCLALLLDPSRWAGEGVLPTCSDYGYLCGHTAAKLVVQWLYLRSVRCTPLIRHYLMHS